MRIDLHAHSNASDGTDTPAELVAAAVGAGLDVVALTDHDTVAYHTEAADAVHALPMRHPADARPGRGALLRGR